MNPTSLEFTLEDVFNSQWKVNSKGGIFALPFDPSSVELNLEPKVKEIKEEIEEKEPEREGKPDLKSHFKGEEDSTFEHKNPYFDEKLDYALTSEGEEN